MARNKPNTPDKEKTVPANETQTEEKAASGNEALVAGGVAPELTAEEAAMLAQESEKALRDIDEEQLEPPPTFDIGREHIPAPDDNVIPFDKINQGLSDKQAAVQEAGQTAAQGKKTYEAEASSEKEAPKAPNEDKTTEKKRRGRPPREGKADKGAKPEKTQKPEKAAKVTKAAAEKETPPPEPEKPPEPIAAPRSNEQEQIVYINLSELHAFKDHPFQVRNDEEMRAMVESVKDKGVTQPAVVRPREDGGYEIVSGHRRQKASELAGYTNMPCIVRNLTDDEAITQIY